MKERLKLSLDKLLKIDTTNRQEIIFGLIGSSVISETFETEKQSEDLLVNLEKFLEKNHSGLSDLSAILVNIGPGSYTGVRVGATVTNTLGWSLNIPVLGYTSENYVEILKTAQKSKKSFGEIVLPIYSEKN